MFVTKDRVENRGFAFRNLSPSQAKVECRPAKHSYRDIEGVASGEVMQSHAAGRLGNGLLVETLHRLRGRLS
jgi:hypothetical protein